jgi:hypothetical protein
MSQALPPGTIPATRQSAAGACADPVGPGMPGPAATCFSCPPGYSAPQLRSWGPGDPGSWFCWPVTTTQGGDQITAPSRSTTGLDMRLVAALGGFGTGFLAMHFFGRAR